MSIPTESPGGVSNYLMFRMRYEQKMGYRIRDELIRAALFGEITTAKTCNSDFSFASFKTDFRNTSKNFL